VFPAVRHIEARGRQLDAAMKNGAGVMLDDLLAAVYAARVRDLGAGRIGARLTRRIPAFDAADQEAGPQCGETQRRLLRRLDFAPVKQTAKRAERQRPFGSTPALAHRSTLGGYCSRLPPLSG
jgi:hypothetical protein